MHGNGITEIFSQKIKLKNHGGDDINAKPSKLSTNDMLFHPKKGHAPYRIKRLVVQNASRNLHNLL